MTSMVILIFIMLINRIESKKIQLSVCKPNSYIFVGCNVCRCDSDGKLNKQFCTKRKCPTETRRAYNVDGSCEPGNWYSSEPCQICYCIFRSKLVCNSVANHDTLQLGQFSFSICGNNFLEAASQLYANKPSQRNMKVLKSSNIIPTTTPEKDLNTDEMLDLLESKRKVNDNTFNERNYRSDSKRAQSLLKDAFFQEAKNDVTDSKIFQRYFNYDDSSHVLGALSLRRGKVRLMNKATCIPGESFVKNCANCFCLQSGKMLCVEKQCGQNN